MELNEIMGADYSPQDVAFALNHHNFGEFRRTLSKSSFESLPREVKPGPGALYRYAHVVESAVLMHVGSAFTLRKASHAVHGLFDKLIGNEYGNAKINELPKKEREVVLMHSTFSSQDDTWGFGRIVDYPQIYLGADFISRDLTKPTFLVFTPLQETSREVDLLDGSVALSEMYAKYLDRVSEYAVDERTASALREDYGIPGVVNLTNMLVRMDERLSIRLLARELKAGRK